MTSVYIYIVNYSICIDNTVMNFENIFFLLSHLLEFNIK